MEHQSAVAYGNRFANGYLERDWTGVGISLEVRLHHRARERPRWFGNAVSAADVADMWIHEGWTTYLEASTSSTCSATRRAAVRERLQVEGQNREPIITRRGIHREPPQDMYFKGALFLNTLRSVVNDDARWWRLLRDLYPGFKYRNILTEDSCAS